MALAAVVTVAGWFSSWKWHRILFGILAAYFWSAEWVMLVGKSDAYWEAGFFHFYGAIVVIVVGLWSPRAKFEGRWPIAILVGATILRWWLFKQEIAWFPIYSFEPSNVYP
jgi:hypothetical protein